MEKGQRGAVVKYPELMFRLDGMLIGRGCVGRWFPLMARFTCDKMWMMMRQCVVLLPTACTLSNDAERVGLRNGFKWISIPVNPSFECRLLFFKLEWHPELKLTFQHPHFSLPQSESHLRKRILRMHSREREKQNSALVIDRDANWQQMEYRSPRVWWRASLHTPENCARSVAPSHSHSPDH